MNFDFKALLDAIGYWGGILLPVLLTVYFFPKSPLRKIVETWIDGRIRAQFSRELEELRHDLSLEAERVKAKYQNDLHNFGIVTTRKHEIFRELYRLLFLADGAVANLFGPRKVPVFDDYSRDDLTQYMASRRFAGRTMESILSSWDTDRRGAIVELGKADRRVDVALAGEAFGEAWNYLLTNSLYLPDSVTGICRKIADELRPILHAAELQAAEIPLDPSSIDIGAKKAQASELLWQLRKELQDLLGVTQNSLPDKPKKD